jgi:hypothetical protein
MRQWLRSRRWQQCDNIDSLHVHSGGPGHQRVDALAHKHRSNLPRCELRARVCFFVCAAGISSCAWNGKVDLMSLFDWPLISPAVLCPAFSFATGVAAGADLSGSTQTAVTSTCAAGYSIGGGSSATTSQTYMCTASGPAASTWSPAPDAAANSCQGGPSLFFFFSFNRVAICSLNEESFALLLGLQSILLTFVQPARARRFRSLHPQFCRAACSPV